MTRLIYPLNGLGVSTPANPASGSRKLYPKTDGWYDLDSSGNEYRLTPPKNIALDPGMSGLLA